MNDALIGSTGFVGGTLTTQRDFDQNYNSKNIGTIAGHTFDTVVCAGSPAQKWLANKNPEADRKNTDSLIDNLKNLSCKNFILISTVDVFTTPINVDEDSIIQEEKLAPYGLNRRRLEKFVANTFENHLIVRLPGLVGTGLKKNIIFDLLNNNSLENIDSRCVYQFYPMANLWSDIDIAIKAGLSLVHLTAEPISVREIAQECFESELLQQLPLEPARYDFKTKHDHLYRSSNDSSRSHSGYQYSSIQTIQAIRDYIKADKQ